MDIWRVGGYLGRGGRASISPMEEAQRRREEKMNEVIVNNNMYGVTLNGFCSICDRCSNCTLEMDNRERYARRDWCGWASIGGISACVSKDRVSLDFIGPEEGKEYVTYPRDDKQKLIEILKAAKASEEAAAGGG